MEEKRCYACGGKLHDWDCNELQKRFSDGVQSYLCDVCAGKTNRALFKSRAFYGIDKKAKNRYFKFTEYQFICMLEEYAETYHLSQQEKRGDVKETIKRLSKVASCISNEATIDDDVFGGYLPEPEKLWVTEIYKIIDDFELNLQEEKEEIISSETKCPTCGSEVKVIGSDEGTYYYKPI